MPKPLESCFNCSSHLVVPDPNDWFCDDDQAVVCKLAKQKPNPKSIYTIDRQEQKAIIVGIRPYNIKKTCKERGIPDWCPKNANCKR